MGPWLVIKMGGKSSAKTVELKAGLCDLNRSLL